MARANRNGSRLYHPDTRMAVRGILDGNLFGWPRGSPGELYEAARLDGAGKLRTFRSITLPLIAPAVTVSVMLSLIMSLKIFDQIFVLTGGGPGGSTHTLSTLMYRDAFAYGNFGRGISLGMLLFVLVACLSIVQYRVLRRREQCHETLRRRHGRLRSSFDRDRRARGFPFLRHAQPGISFGLTILLAH